MVHRVILKESKMRLATHFEQMGHIYPVYIYIYTYVHVYIYIYAYIYIYTCTYVYIYMRAVQFSLP